MSAADPKEGFAEQQGVPHRKGGNEQHGTSPENSPEQGDGEESGKQTGRVMRGGLAIAAAKIYFMVTGLAQQIALEAIVGLGGYGAYSTAASVASISYNPTVQTSIQGVSRVVAAETGERVPASLRRTLGYHVVAAVLSSLGFFLAAKPVAFALGAPHITGTLRILSGILLIYGLYAPLVGALNGLRRFVSQAGLDVLAATLRTAGLLGGAYLGLRASWDLAGGSSLHPSANASEALTATEPLTSSQMGGVEGAVAGFVAASLIVLGVAIKLTGVGRSGAGGPGVARYLSFVVPIFGGQLLLNVLFQADALLLRRFASEAAQLAGQVPSAADPFVGAYRSAQLFCFLPYQLLMSVTFILFPLLASAHAQGNRQAVRDYVRAGVRLAALLSGLMISLLIALPHGLISLVYGPDAAALGGDAMRILAVGLGSFAVLGVMISALNSLGAERASLTIITVAVVLVTSLCWFFARGVSLSQELLERTAWATATALVTATIAAAWAVRRTAAGVMSWLSLIRILGSCAVTATAIHFAFAPDQLGTGRAIALTLGAAVVTPFVYALLLVTTGELNRDDAQRLQALVRVRKK